MILGIESSSDKISIAIVDNEKVIHEKEYPEPRKHSEQIGDLVNETLHNTMASIKGVAISGGPGSYTGLRIGSSLAKGLCYALDVPLMSVNSLLSCAWPFLDSVKNTDSTCVVVLPSRKNEVYSAVLRAGAISDEVESRSLDIADFAAWIKDLEVDTINILGPGSALVLDPLSSSDQTINHLADVTSKASSVAILGEMRLKNGLVENISAYEPDYLKPFVAKQGTPIFERLEQNRKRDTK